MNVSKLSRGSSGEPPSASCTFMKGTLARAPAISSEVSRPSRAGSGGSSVFGFAVGSRIVDIDRPDVVRMRGLKWRRWLASPMAVDLLAPASETPVNLNQRMDAPSGASFYVTRACIDRIGLMDARYFLYYEDLDWGLRAKAACGLGYAHDSVVPHVGGSSIGPSRDRASRSTLSVYLEFRNRLLFVKQRFPGWYLWTVLITALRATEFLIAGSPRNCLFAFRGAAAGLFGETGRPDHLSAGESKKPGQPVNG